MERRTTPRAHAQHRAATVNQRGTSLVEVLVTLVLSAVLATMGVAFTRSILLTMRRHDAAGAMQQAAATALDLMVRDIQTAGCAASLNAHPGIRLAQPDVLKLASDLNADGDTDDPSERTTYALNSDKGTITRASGNGSPQPLLRGVAGSGLRFHYAIDGSETPAPGSEDGALRAITSVRIEVGVSATQDTPPLQLSRTATLRNR